MTDDFDGRIAKEYLQELKVAFDETEDERFIVYNELLGESPRASVLVGAAWLEEILSDLIGLALPDDEKVTKVFPRFFNSFYRRIEAAHDLRVISRTEYDRLHTIRQIRNEFAHQVKVTFEDPDIAKLIAMLIPIIALSDKPPPELPDLNDPQERYGFLVTILYFLIYGRISLARKSTDIADRLDKLRGISKGIGNLEKDKG